MSIDIYTNYYTYLDNLKIVCIVNENTYYIVGPNICIVIV